MKTNKQKETAIALRLKGKSIRDIEATLKINRSTLSGWLKNVPLTPKQKEKLYKQWLEGLARSRLKAAEVHRRNKQVRLAKIYKETEDFLLKTNLNKNLEELLFSIFYLAEGTKNRSSVIFANSNPSILKGITNLFRSIYKIDESKFSCCLHLRSDQSDSELKKFWSRQLDIPESRFIKTQFDKRTTSKTYEYYKGVCVIYYYDAALMHRIMYLGDSLVKRWSNYYN